jgi:uncharacterized protein (TIGR02646 family)
MIRVARPATAPRVLTDRGATQRDTLCAQFDEAPDEYISGRRKLKIDSAIYGHRSVKQTLIAAQHGKCAFCESKLKHVAHGDIEHFRPKAGYLQEAGEKPLKKPGYYWLAYEWTNLLFACQICNQQGKKNLFPLVDPARRAVSHHDDVGAEEPLLIDPAAVDPQDYIGFREEVAYGLPGRPHGKTTIEVLGLNRQALCEARRDHLMVLKLLNSQRALLSLSIENARGEWRAELLAKLREIEDYLESAQRNDAEYSAMSRAALG